MLLELESEELKFTSLYVPSRLLKTSPFHPLTIHVQSMCTTLINTAKGFSSKKSVLGLGQGPATNENGKSWRNGVLNFSRLVPQIQLMMQKAQIILLTAPAPMPATKTSRLLRF